MTLDRLLRLVHADIMKVVRLTSQDTSNMTIQFLQNNRDKVPSLAVQLAVDDLIYGRLMEGLLIKVGAVVNCEFFPSLSVSAQNILRLLDDPLQ